jgi:hypothetical protein
MVNSTRSYFLLAAYHLSQWETSMGGHLRLGQESPLQALDGHIMARLAQDAFIFNSKVKTNL